MACGGEGGEGVSSGLAKWWWRQWGSPSRSASSSPAQVRLGTEEGREVSEGCPGAREAHGPARELFPASGRPDGRTMGSLWRRSGVAAACKLSLNLKLTQLT